MSSLCAMVITKNEEEMIGDCLASLKFADEIIVVDTGNTDNTNAISKKYGAKIVPTSVKGYANFRNEGLKKVTSDWILFVDADERVSPGLQAEIKSLITQSETKSYYFIPRKNNYLGKFMNHGGWGREKIARLFKRSQLRGYSGELHEQPDVIGDGGNLSSSLEHFSHRDLYSMVEKTIVFTDYESQLRLAANHPQIKSWRLVRVMLTEFKHRFIKLAAVKDGPQGVVDGMFQVFNMFIIYARLWEKQRAK